MYSSKDLLPYEDALNRTLENIKELDPARCPLREATGKVLSESINSKEYSPNADLSAMDGFAFRWDDLKPNTPIKIQINNVLGAGDENTKISLLDHQAVQVMTGAIIPEKLDTVVPIENTRTSDENGSLWIKSFKNLRRGSNVRKCGEDYRPNDVILKKDTLITSAHSLLLSTMGYDSINVVRRPRIAIISTGNELVTDYRASLKPGQIRNSNYIYLHVVLNSMNLDIVNYSQVKDDPIAITDYLNKFSMSADIIITIGGISKGLYDYVPAAINNLGGRFIFRGVAIRPGKPCIHAELPSKNTNIFCLPGNPIAMMAAFRFIVFPYLRKLSRLPELSTSIAVLKNPVNGKPPFTRFVLGNCTRSSEKQYVDPIDIQSPSKVSSLSKADSWIIVPPEIKKVSIGSEIQIMNL